MIIHISERLKNLYIRIISLNIVIDTTNVMFIMKNYIHL